MRIKTKVAWGISALVLLILVVGVVSSYFIYRLSNVSARIIKDNFNSVEYCRDMLKSIDNIHQSYILYTFSGQDTIVNIQDGNNVRAGEVFDKTLHLEESNLTESGEKEAVSSLRNAFQDYITSVKAARMLPSSKSQKLLPQLTVSYYEIRNNIIAILNLNLNAIQRKSDLAQDVSEKAIWTVSFLGLIALAVSLPILINLPGYIANPIIEIKDKIREIANRNYDQKLLIQSNDELGEMAVEFNKMTEKLQQYQHSNYAQIITEKGRVDSIVRSLDEGLILLDEDYRIKIINPVASELMGLDLKDVLEQYAPDVAIKNDLFRELIRDLEEGKGKEHKFLRITLHNEENYFNKEIYKVERTNPETGMKETAGFIISLRNVTAFKKLDLAKTNFIAIVSHELKTPISSINLSLKLLQDPRVGALNDEQKRLVVSVKEEADRMSRITGELLDMSQVETGNIRLQIEPVNPADILRISIEVMAPHIRSKNILLVQDISTELPFVKADLEKTVWVMTNLLSNAVRYTPPNGKIILSTHPSLKEVQFSVEDTGAGIEPKNKEKIFQRFVQVDGSKPREGVGLGLAISKEFIHEQGGRIWVESEMGVGSKFVFTLIIA